MKDEAVVMFEGQSLVTKREEERRERKEEGRRDKPEGKTSRMRPTTWTAMGRREGGMLTRLETERVGMPFSSSSFILFTLLTQPTIAHPESPITPPNTSVKSSMLRVIPGDSVKVLQA